jgi:phosphoribosylaminoimidazole-succinocarboxamide synthase
MSDISPIFGPIPYLIDSHSGKVRNNYTIDKNGVQKLISVTSDRISVFDFNLDVEIPYKGMILNLITRKIIEQFDSTMQHWVDAYPHPNVIIGKNLDMIPLEVIVRKSHLGSMYKAYLRALEDSDGDPGFILHIGQNELGRYAKEGHILRYPAIDFTSKSEHDEPISRTMIVDQGILDYRQLRLLESVVIQYFTIAFEFLDSKGIFLAETKFEFGYDEVGRLTIADEICTPDSSRMYIKTQENPYSIPISKQYARDRILQNNSCISAEELRQLNNIKGLTSEQVLYMQNIYLLAAKKICGEDCIAKTTTQNSDKTLREMEIYSAISHYIHQL